MMTHPSILRRPAWAVASFLLLLACTGAPPEVAPPPAPQEIPAHPDGLKYAPLHFEVPDAASMRTELASGAVAFLREDDTVPVIDLQILVNTGSYADPAGKEGLIELTGSLMRSGGTKALTPEELDEELDFLAAQLAIHTEGVSGSIQFSVLAKDLDRGLEILRDVLTTPAFRPERLETLKAVTLEGLKARNDSTSSIEDRETNRLFYGDFPINRLPTKASIESITREDIVACHARTYHPSRFTLAAAGAFRKSEFLPKLEKLLAGFEKQPRTAASTPKITHEPKPAVYCIHKEGANVTQGRVTIGHMGIDIHHPDVQAIRIMSYILGAGGFSARMVQKVRTEEGLAYSVGTDFRPGFLHPWPFRIEFQSKNESCAYAAQLCLQEVRKIQEEGVTQKELKDAVQFYLDGFPGLFFSTSFQTVQTFARAEMLGFPADYYRTYREKIAALTPADIQRVAREHLKPDRFLWIFTGNIDAIRKGDGKHPAQVSDFGPVIDVPLPDPLTLTREAEPRSGN